MHGDFADPIFPQVPALPLRRRLARAREAQRYHKERPGRNPERNGGGPPTKRKGRGRVSGRTILGEAIVASDAESLLQCVLGR